MREQGGGLSERKGVVPCNVKCPMCGAVNEQYRLNPRVFWYDTRSVDLQPRQLQARVDLQGCEPPLLEMWHCPSCYFTADHQHFPNPMKDVLIRIETIVDGLRDLQERDSTYRACVRLLSEGIVLTEPSYSQALQLTLLAIYMWDRIGGMVKQSYGMQAHYCMMLGWLLRDRQELDHHPQKTNEALHHWRKELATYWPEMPLTEEAALKMAIGYYEQSLGISSFVRSPVREATALQRVALIRIALGDALAAREVLLECLTKAQAAKKEIMDALRQNRKAASMGGDERQTMVEDERKLTHLIDDNQRLLSDMRDQIIAKQRDKAVALLDRAKRMTTDQQREVLLRNGIERKLINELLGEKTDSKKGGFLSSLLGGRE